MRNSLDNLRKSNRNRCKCNLAKNLSNKTHNYYKFNKYMSNSKIGKITKK